MSSPIPFHHPSLVLGNIIDTKVLDVIKQMQSCQQSSDIAQEKMNSLITMKRSLAMTMNELMDMDVDISDVQNNLKNIDGSIATAANEYITKKLSNESNLQQLKEQLANIQIEDTIESPIDFSKSEITTKPLSVESLKLDAQYFSFDINTQTDTLAKIESFIKESTQELGTKSTEIAQKATTQAQQQHKQHNIAGTLIITASCTHKNVAMIEPCILDPDKSVMAWNQLHANNHIDTSDLAQLHEANTSNKNVMNLLTGASYGSSFVGMVHILNTEESNDNVTDDMISKLNQKMRLGGWLAENTGGLGVSESMLDEVQKMVDTKKVNSHVTLLTMGVVTTIASNKLRTGLQSILTTPIANGTTASNSHTTVDSSASTSVESKRKIETQNLRSAAVLKELQASDVQSNQIMDINSLMAAFDNYLTSIKDKDEITGVPIGYHTKKINQQQVIDLWLEKYNKEPIAKTT